MKVWVEKARRPEMIGGLGGFAGLFDASALTPLRPPAAGHLHRRRRHQGRDRPGDGHPRHDRLRPGRHGRRRPRRLRRRAAVHDRLHRHRPGRTRSGSPRSSRASPRPASQAGCALIGGETAEHPGLLGPDEYDVAGATTGVVEADRLLGPGRVRPGDVVLAMESSAACTPTATPWSATCCSDDGAGWALDRARRRARPHPRRGAARADPHLRQGLPRPGRPHRRPTRCRTSPAAAWPPTSSG